MKLTLLKFPIFVLLVFSACPHMAAQGSEPKAAVSTTRLRTWQAGSVVTAGAVRSFGINRCFISLPLTDAQFRRMKGRSFNAGCPVSRSRLRYLRLLHYDGEGHIRLGELICHQSIAPDLLTIFRTLYNAHYPIGRMTLIDHYDGDDERSMSANNTSCFNHRPIAGTHTLSRHSYGLAIDVNPLYNPYVVPRRGRRTQVMPAAGARYANRSHPFDFKIDHNDLCYRLFRQHGFSWGGDWHHRKDYQHFEKSANR